MGTGRWGGGAREGGGVSSCPTFPCQLLPPQAPVGPGPQAGFLLCIVGEANEVSRQRNTAVTPCEETYSREEGERLASSPSKGQRRLCTSLRTAGFGWDVVMHMPQEVEMVHRLRKEGQGERQTARPAVLRACGQEGWGVGASLSHPAWFLRTPVTRCRPWSQR